MSTVTGTTFVQDFLFKGDESGISKKNGNEWRRLTLHDPATLDNLDFFLDESSEVTTAGLKLKDKVQATMTMALRFGRLQPVVLSVVKM